LVLKLRPTSSQISELLGPTAPPCWPLCPALEGSGLRDSGRFPGAASPCHSQVWRASPCHIGGQSRAWMTQAEAVDLPPTPASSQGWGHWTPPFRGFSHHHPQGIIDSSLPEVRATSTSCLLRNKLELLIFPGGRHDPCGHAVSGGSSAPRAQQKVTG
jgi:hypothetical protein